MTTTRAIAVFGVLAFAACKQKALPVDETAVRKAVADYISEHSTNPVPAAQVNKFYLESRRLNKTEQKRFRETYDQTLKLYEKVTKDRRSQRSVLDFLVRTAAVGASQEAPKAEPGAVTSQNSTYLAFAMASGSGVDYDSIDEVDYLDRLARAYMVPRADVERAVYESLIQDRGELVAKAAGVVELNLAGVDAATPEQFAVNVLLPYLTLVVTGSNLAEKHDAQVAAAFRKKFGGDADPAPLPTLVEKFRAFLKGEDFDTQHLLRVNTELKKQSLWLYLQEGHASIYKLLDQKVDVNSRGLQRVRAMQRLGVSLIPVSNALSVYQDPDVMLVVDALRRRQLEVADTTGGGKRFLTFSKFTIESWRELELPLDEGKAYAAVEALVRSAFEQQSPDQVAAALFRGAAIHATKRKWDEAAAEAAEWVAMDFEIASSLTEIALGPAPAYGLVFLIERLQDFYAEQSRAVEGARLSEEGLAQLHDLLKKSWQLALEVQEQHKPAKDLQAAARELYKRYRPANGKSLTDIEAYRSEIYARTIERAQPFKL
ncbi:MAG: hypothetical protein JXR83_02110 [Deltaproteobacteria bacterium]|nr:hypothetical protein [Deltaproteobacteria bacterium]